MNQLRVMAASLSFCLFTACGGTAPITVDSGLGGGGEVATGGGGEVSGGGAGGGAEGGGAGGGSLGGGAGGGGGTSNTAPAIAALSPVTVDEGATTSINLMATDAENDPISFSLTGPPPFATLTGSTLVLAPDFTHAGPYTLSITASDGAASSTASLEVTVVNVNRPPVLMAISDVALIAGASQELTLSANDPDGDSLTLTAMNLPSWAALAGDTLTLAPPAGTVDSRTLTVTATDPGNLADSKSFQLVVNLPPNLAPALSALTQVDAAGNPIAPGTSVTAVPRLRAQVDDPEDATVRLEAEVVLSSASFADTQTHSGVLGPEGQVELTLSSLPPGSYKWQLRALDAAGNASAWTPFNGGNTAFVVPMSTVQGSIVVNANQPATNDPNVELTLTSSGSATITELCFSNDGITFVQCAPPVATKSWVLAGGDGMKTVFARIRDEHDVTLIVQDSIIFDQTPPQVTQFAINAGAAETNDANVTLSWTATDALSGVTASGASNDGTAFTALGGSPASWALGATQGVRTVSLRVTDLAGNQTVVTDTITLDTVAPVISSANIEGGVAWINRTTVAFNVTAADGSSGSGLADLCVTGDATGCRSYAPSVQFELSPADGPKSVSVTVRDAAGNVSAPTALGIGLDRAAPSLSAISVMNGAPLVNGTFVSIALTAADTGGSGLSTVRCRTNGGAFGTAMPYAASLNYTMAGGDGLKTIGCTVTDLAGNVSGEASDDITLDTTPPTGSFVINPGNPAFTTSTAVSLVFSASDLNGVTHYCANTSGAVPASAGAPCWTPVASTGFTLPTGDGAKTVSVFFRDAAMNFSTTPATDGITLDTTPPALSVGGAGLGLAAGAQFTNQLSVVFNHLATDATSGLGQVCIGTSNPPTNCSPYTTTPSALLAVGDGPKTVYLRVLDAAGNQSVVQSDTITLDQTPPALSNVQVNANATYTNARGVTVTSAASDSNGVTQVELSLDGTSFGAPITYAASVPFTLTGAEGTKTVSLRAIDAAGNRSTLGSDSIILDETAPTLSITLNGGARYTAMNPVSVAISATETGSGVFRHCLKDTANGAAAPATPLPTDPCFVSYVTPATLTVGTQSDRRVYAWLIDNAGNVSAAASEVIWHDSVNPGFVAAPTFTAGHRSIALSWANASDGSSGVQGYEVGTSRVSGGPYVYGTLVPNDPSGTTSTTVTAPNGVPQFVVVRTVDNAGNRSTNSVAITATPRYPFTHQQRLPVAAHLRGLAWSSSANRYFVAGINGALYSSDDALVSFTRRDPMSDEHLLAAHVSSNGEVWLVGSGGHLSRSTDDGETFSRVTNTGPSNRDLTAFSPAGQTGAFPFVSTWYVAVGTGGTIVRGSTGTLVTEPVFAPVTSGTTANLAGVARCSSSSGACLNGNVLIAVGANGTILRSADNGATWTAITPPAGYATASFTSVVAMPDLNTFFVGATAPSGHGPLIRSVNGGLTFTEVLTPNYTDVTVVDSLAALGSDLFLSGAVGPVTLISKLNNITRTDQTLPGGLGRMRALAFRSATELAAVGQSGEIALTTAQPTWVRRNTGLLNELFDLSMPANFSTAAWAVGSNGTILRTTNSGTTWSPQTSATGNTLNAIETVDTNGTAAGVFALAVGFNGSIIRTTNGGTTWTVDPDSGIVTANLNDVACRSLTACVAVGGAGTILTYNGSGWVTSFTGGTRAFNALTMYVSGGGATNRGVAVGAGGLLYTLTGTTWTPQPDISTNDFTGVAAKSDNGGIVIAVGSNGAIYKSASHGATFTPRTSGTTFGLRDVANVPGTSIWYATGNAGLALKSVNDGETWSALETSSSEHLNGIAVGGIAGRAWFAGASGTVLFTTVSGQ